MGLYIEMIQEWSCIEQLELGKDVGALVVCVNDIEMVMKLKLNQLRLCEVYS